MKRCFSTALAAAVLGLAGCATRPMIDYDGEFIGTIASYQTFDLAPSNSRSEFREIVLSPIVDRRIADATVDDLESRGYIRTANDPDFIVRFDTATRTKRSFDSFFVPSAAPPDSPLYGSGGTMEYSYREYEEGTFIIDIIDGETDELVWRGALSRRLGQEAPDRATVDGIVTSILERFPPQPDSES